MAELKDTGKKYTFQFSKGIGYSLLAALVFALMGACVKIAGRQLSSVNIVFYRNVLGVAVILLSLYKNPLRNTGGRFGLLMFRGFIGTMALFTLFYNMRRIGLGKSITYIQTSTIFVAVLSFFFLKEKLSIWGWMAVFTGFAGILFIFRPGPGGSMETDLLGIFNGLAAGAAYTAVRELKKYYDTRSIVLSFMGWGVFLSLSFMLITPHVRFPGMEFLFSEFALPAGITWLWVILVGITAMLGQIFITKAYGEDKAGIVSTIGYTNIPFAILIGYLLGDKVPDALTLFGMALVIVSGIIIAIRRNY